jgi:hypothetical protein
MLVGDPHADMNAVAVSHNIHQGWILIDVEPADTMHGQKLDEFGTVFAFVVLDRIPLFVRLSMRFPRPYRRRPTGSTAPLCWSS